MINPLPLFVRPYLLITILGALVLLSTFPDQGVGQTKNGFDLSNSSIEPSKIKQGGPPRDGIPSLDDPKFITSNEAGYLNSDDRILGIHLHGTAKAYPIKILNWHEIVNDQIGNNEVLVTYCPLCGSGMAFDAEVEGRSLEFGVSGLLYNSDVLMYDRETESLWSQLMAKSVSGAMKGTQLEQISITHTTWEDWNDRHPESKVLSDETGHDRNYERSPYKGYKQSNQVYFPVENKDSKYHYKELVSGVIQDDVKVAYPFPELEKSNTPFDDQLNGKTVTVHFDEKHQTARIVTQDGEEVPTVTLYWFAWSAFYPEGRVYTH